MIAFGKKLYAENCAGCLDENLEGEPDWKIQNEDSSIRSSPQDARGHTKRHSDQVLRESIKLWGESLPEYIAGFIGMPAFINTFSEDEITQP